MFTIVGIEIKSGHFTSKDNGKEIVYNNLYLYVIGEELPMSVEHIAFGNGVDTVKIRNDEATFLSIFGKGQMTKEEIKNWLGKKIDVMYDKRGNVARVNFLK